MNLAAFYWIVQSKTIISTNSTKVVMEVLRKGRFYPLEWKLNERSFRWNMLKLHKMQIGNSNANFCEEKKTLIIYVFLGVDFEIIYVC